MASLAQPLPDDPEAIMEMREASPSHFLTKIESFSLLGKHGIYKYETREFIVGDYKRLIIYPNGHKRGIDEEGYVSVYLAIANTSTLRKISVRPDGGRHCLSVFLHHVASIVERVNVCYTIRIKTRILTKHQSKTDSDQWFSAPTMRSWGWNSFIELASLNDPKGGFVVNEYCLLEIENSVQAIA